jgi:hypothetical protein
MEMKLRVSLIALVAVLSGTISVLAQTSGSQTLTGFVSDAMCGSAHMMKGKTDAECTRACVKSGQKYALVVGKDVYTLEGHEADLDKYAGQKVMLKGAVSGQSVKVTSVVPAKQ